MQGKLIGLVLFNSWFGYASASPSKTLQDPFGVSVCLSVGVCVCQSGCSCLCLPVCQCVCLTLFQQTSFSLSHVNMHILEIIIYKV